MKKYQKQSDHTADGGMIINTNELNKSFKLFEYFCGLRYYTQKLSILLNIKETLLLVIKIMLLQMENEDLVVAFYPDKYWVNDILNDIFTTVLPNILNTCKQKKRELKALLSESIFTTQQLQQLKYLRQITKISQRIFEKSDISDDLKGRVLQKLGRTYTTNILTVNIIELERRTQEVKQMKRMSSDELLEWLKKGSKRSHQAKEDVRDASGEENDNGDSFDL